MRYKERVRVSVSYQSRNEEVGSGTPIKFNSLYHQSGKKSLQIRFFGVFALESIRVSTRNSVVLINEILPYLEKWV